MKYLYTILIVVLLASCGPSAEQLAVTAEAVKAQTQTAAPTLTPTLTSTPTITPTITASPTPSIPMAQGRIQVNFVPLSDEVIIPRQSQDLGFTLTANGKETVVQTSEADGSFAIYLDPGTYVIDSLTIKNQDLGADAIEFITDQIEVTIPSQPCYNAGDITFTILRLPPGSFDEQLAIVQNLAGGAPIYFQHFESGGFLMPTLTEIAGSGNCPKLTDAPEGFVWSYLSESHLAVLLPGDWHFKNEQTETIKAYYISLEDIDDEGSFKTGMTITVVNDKSITAVQNARNFSANIYSQNNVTKTGEVTERTEGDLTIYELQYDADYSSYQGTNYNLVAANKETNTLYVITFESPKDNWDEAWKIGQVMIEQIIFLENQQ